MRIRLARKSARLTQQKLADICGVSRPAVVQWERSPARGKRTTPSLDHIKKVAAATGYSAAWLLTGEGEAFVREPSATYNAGSADTITPEEQAILDLYRQMPRQDRVRLRAIIDAMGITENEPSEKTG